MIEPVAGGVLGSQEAAPDQAVLHDRRRPGRREVDPSLIPLLRNTGPSLVGDGRVNAADDGAGREQRDDMAPVMGIVRGLGIVSLGWIVVAACILL